MTIVWEPTKGNHFQSQVGYDKFGNKFQVSANLETVFCRTPDNFTGNGWTAQDALESALFDRREAAKSYVTKTNIWATLSREDQEYWTRQAEAILADEAKTCNG